ncbi:MAG: hypothetical protein ACW98X_25150 [Promethearchaeota archaeon]|jgi:hypothetical protein
MGVDKFDDDFISGFLTSILDISQKIGGGEIRSLNFRNYNIVYSYDDEKLCIFILITDINDSKEELELKLELLKKEFIKQYREDLINWDSDISKFERFDEFAENNIFIPPIILLIGEEGVGKRTIMNLFPGEIILDTDDEILTKTVKLNSFEKISKCIIHGIDIENLTNRLKLYMGYLDSADIICFVTNSGASNLNRTRNFYSILKPKLTAVDHYVIANFQDLKQASFEPEEIEELFEIKTYGFSAIAKDARENIQAIILELIYNSLIDK